MGKIKEVLIYLADKVSNKYGIPQNQSDLLVVGVANCLHNDPAWRGQFCTNSKPIKKNTWDRIVSDISYNLQGSCNICIDDSAKK